MKKTLVLLTGCLLAVFSQAQDIHSVPIGTTLPLANEKLTEITGKTISIQEARMKNGVLVMFSCNTCPYVIKNQQRTRDLASFARQHQVGVILLNPNEAARNDADSYNAMKEYGKQQSYDFYYAVDKQSRIADALGATRTPEVFLFDAAGILQYKGAIDDNPTNQSKVTREHAKEAITEMALGKPVSVKESRSLGCAIKRE